MKIANPLTCAVIVAALLGASPSLSGAAQPQPEVSGTWSSELGPVTLRESDGQVTGFWLTRTGRRGVIEAGRLQGTSLVLEYTWPWVPIRGTAAFSWNKLSRRWEGSWRHVSGAVGVWNLADRVATLDADPMTSGADDARAPAHPPFPPPAAATEFAKVADPGAPAPVQPVPAPAPPPPAAMGSVATAAPIPPAPWATPQPAPSGGWPVPPPPGVSPVAAPPAVSPTPLPPGVPSVVPPAPPTAPLSPAPPPPAAPVPASPPGVAPKEWPAPAAAHAPGAPPPRGGLTLGNLEVSPAPEWALEKHDATAIVLRRTSDLAGAQIRALGPAAGPLASFVDRMRGQTLQFGGSDVAWRDLPDTSVAGLPAKQAEIDVSGNTAPARTRQVFFDAAGTRFVISFGCEPGAYAGAVPAFEDLLRAIAIR